MYKLAVKTDFFAQHFLVGVEAGPENQRHSHHYRVEVKLQGKTLDEHGYLVDIVKIKEKLEALIDAFRDRTLNELPEFQDKNPSIEQLASIFHRRLSGSLPMVGIAALTVRIFEDESAWASFRQE
jgi:6-pyruvoyltetrahydropterin/6-carboxytetrahydropterin synthase